MIDKVLIFVFACIAIGVYGTFFWRVKGKSKVKIKINMPAKDPMDWRLTKNSKKWDVEYYCSLCKSATGHEEFMSYICNSCGGHGNTRERRSYRSIWDGSKWVTQEKYGNGEDDYEIVQEPRIINND